MNRKPALLVTLVLLLAGCAGKKEATAIADTGTDSDAAVGTEDGSTTAQVDASADASGAPPAIDAVAASDAPALDVDAVAPKDAASLVDAAAAIDFPAPAADATAPPMDPDADASALPVTDAGREADGGEGFPLDLYIMFDQSGSMAIKDDGMTTRMQVVRDALGQFLRAPESNGLGIGIGFFGYHPLSCRCTSCDPADYATPAVPVGLLPQYADQVVSALANVQPVGETPTGPAIRGACRYAGARRQAEPSRRLAILLVTDGEPQARLTAARGICDPTLADAVSAAQQCLSSGVRTYVLGVGPSLENLGQIAAAGGTSRAYLVSSGARQAILDMLSAIRADATP